MFQTLQILNVNDTSTNLRQQTPEVAPTSLFRHTLARMPTTTTSESLIFPQRAFIFLAYVAPPSIFIAFRHAPIEPSLAEELSVLITILATLFFAMLYPIYKTHDPLIMYLHIICSLVVFQYPAMSDLIPSKQTDYYTPYKWIPNPYFVASPTIADPSTQTLYAQLASGLFYPLLYIIQNVVFLAVASAFGDDVGWFWTYEEVLLTLFGWLGKVLFACGCLLAMVLKEGGEGLAAIGKTLAGLGNGLQDVLSIMSEACTWASNEIQDRIISIYRGRRNLNTAARPSQNNEASYPPPYTVCARSKSYQNDPHLFSSHYLGLINPHPIAAKSGRQSPTQTWKRNSPHHTRLKYVYFPFRSFVADTSFDLPSRSAYKDYLDRHIRITLPTFLILLTGGICNFFGI